MTTVVVSPCNVAAFPEGGGHFWVYLQYVLGLRQLGCDVYWLEEFRPRGTEEETNALLAPFLARMKRFGLEDKVILYTEDTQRRPSAKHGALGVPTSACSPDHTLKRELQPAAPEAGVPIYFGRRREEAEAIFERAGLLLNFHYVISPALLARFRRTALVDIDPGLLQFWMSRGQLSVPQHDCYFTISENVGKSGGKIPDCGLNWIPIRPAVCLERWPCVVDGQSEAFTTVSIWDSSDWVVDGKKEYENTKRVAYLEYADLPRLTTQPLELALFLRTERDFIEQKNWESRGWRIRHSREVAATPEMYQSYIHHSRGEFSCAKPSYIKLQTAWVSDRTVCYLASGKPVVVQDTGPSDYLPNGEGMFRFTTARQAAQAFKTINADYERHCHAARKLAETYFDARQVVGKILSHALDKAEAAATSPRLESLNSPVWAPQWASPVLRRHGAL